MTNGPQHSRSPSVAELQRLIKEQSDLEFTLVNGEKLKGKLKWYDETAFSVVQKKEGVTTLLRSAVIAYRKVSQ